MKRIRLHLDISPNIAEHRLRKSARFVVMPDHIHLLLTPTKTLERAMSLIKGGFSHRLASKLPVWQRSFTDHRIRDREDFLIRLAYIHQNPVRAHLTPTAELYPYSSAFLPNLREIAYTDRAQTSDL